MDRSRFVHACNKPRVRGGFALLAAWLCAAFSHAAPSDLDLTFGIGGRGFADVTGADTVYGEAIALAPGNKLVVTGRCLVIATSTTHFCVIRVLSNGFFDLDFNGSGNKRIFANPGDTEVPRAVAVQPDSKVVIAGQCGPLSSPTHMCVVRLLADGSADDSFGTSGKVQLGGAALHAGINTARTVSILPDGKILLGGSCSALPPALPGACVVRLLSNGSLDPSFGSAGRSFLRNALSEYVNSMQVASDGAILVASEGDDTLPPATPAPKVYVSRLLSGGSYDTSFSGTGTQTLSESTIANRLPRLARQPDGKAIVLYLCAGVTYTNGQCGARLNNNGALDTTFVYDRGRPKASIDPGEYGMRPLVQADGKVVSVASQTALSLGSTLDFQVWRLLEDGSADSQYTASTYLSMLAADDRANDAVIQSDEKVVIAGSCFTGSRYQMCLARLQAGPFGARNCSMDIDGDGRVYATTDALILARVALGIRGSDVMNGIATTGTRNSWPAVRDYLVDQCSMTHIGP